MKKSLIKNNLKSISKTRRRFLSILVMAFLGVGFYSGLVASSPDMLDSLDKYVDNSNMYDVNIISTLGLTDEDITAIEEIDGVEKAYGLQSKDTFVEFDDKQNICKVIEYNENVNRPVLITGRMPENSDECLLENGNIVSGNAEENLGKTIIIQNDDLDEDDTPIFTKKELKVVGIIESPLYISSERGNTSLGSGDISFYIYCKDDIINFDYYTEIAVKVKGANEAVTDSDEYLEVVNPVIQEIENIKETREQARYDSLVNEANNKLNDAQKEYDDKKAEVEAELKDAESQINDAKTEISNSETKLKNSESELNKQEREANQKFAEAEKQISDAEAKINSTIQAIGMETPELKASRAELEKQRNELEANKKTTANKIKNGRTQIANGRKELENAKSELAEKEQEFIDSKAEAEQKLSDAQKEIDDAREEISKIEKAKWYIQERMDNTGYSNIFDAIKTMSNISKMFPIIFFLVAVLISLTTMTRMIEEERIEIGTLKALGYTNLQIMSKYILYAFLACVIGGILGMTICFYLLPSIVWMLYSIIYTIPEFYISYRFSIGLTGILISFICIGGATILAAYRELKESPSVLMRPKPPKNGKRIFMERITFIWKKLNFSKKITIRNIFRYKKRAIITIVGIAGCTGLMLAGFGIRDSVTDIPNLQFEEVFKYEASAALTKTDSLDDIKEYLSQNDNVENYVEVVAGSWKISKGKKSYDITLFVPNNKDEIDKICDLKDFSTGEKLQISDDGIIITDKMADEFNIKVGDEITLTDGDDIEYKMVVKAITRNYVGHYVYMSKEFYEANIKSYEINMIFINIKDVDTEVQNTISEELLNIDGVASFTNMSSLVKSVSDMLNTMNYIVVVLIVTSALLAFVVLYNLANINISERQREIATLKVLGFYDKEVDDYINKENIIFTILGVIFGLGFGILLTNGIIGSIEIDNLRFTRTILPSSYAISAVITISFSLIVNFIIHFVLKKIDMIESLKSVE